VLGNGIVFWGGVLLVLMKAEGKAAAQERRRSRALFLVARGAAGCSGVSRKLARGADAFSDVLQTSF